MCFGSEKARLNSIVKQLRNSLKMKIDYLKIADTMRWIFCILFITLALLAIVGIYLGRTQHILTLAGCIVMVYMTAKHW